MRQIPVQDPEFWDKSAPSFTRHASGGGYIGRFLEITQPEPRWSVPDIYCTAGTLAVPLAPMVRTITALDYSKSMLELLDKSCRNQKTSNIRRIHGRWEDDGGRPGITAHDVAVASRSLIVEDLRYAVKKLVRPVSRRVINSTLTDDGPFDRRVFELEKTLASTPGGWQMPCPHQCRRAVMWWNNSPAETSSGMEMQESQRVTSCPANP